MALRTPTSLRHGALLIRLAFSIVVIGAVCIYWILSIASPASGASPQPRPQFQAQSSILSKVSSAARSAQPIATGTPATRTLEARLRNSKLRDSLPQDIQFAPNAATPSPTCPPYWSYVQNPQVGTGSNEPTGISAISSSDGWLVGYNPNSSSTGFDTQTQHWDGAEWTTVPSPNGDYNNNFLYAVSALSSNDVWAVGSSNSYNQGQVLIIHWNGTQWQRSAVNMGNLPNPELHGILAISTGDVWAVGSTRQDGNTQTQTLTLHWNGMTWSVVPSPNYDNSNGGLKGVAATASNDVWAVGSANNSAQYREVSLTLHWDGIAWSLVPSPNWTDNYNNYLESVSALSPTDVWAAGFIDGSGNGMALALHWDGTTWSRVQTPYLPPYSAFEKVVARAPDNVWFAGDTDNSTLVERWDGTSWTPMATPNGPAGTDSSLVDLSMLSDSEAWAAGEYLDPQSGRRYIFTLHYAAGSCPTPTFNPISTSTPSTATLTPAPSVTSDCSLPWAIWPNPGGTGNTVLSGVTAISPNDVWAVGYQTDQGAYRTLTMHWDGVQWSVVPSPNANTSNNYLYAVSAVSSTDVWAVGAFWTSGSTISTLTIHWDGQQWEPVFSPDPNNDRNWLLAVNARATNDVWAVGSFSLGTELHTFVEHWDGTNWSLTYTPNLYYEDILYGVSAVAQDNIWADGTSDYTNIMQHSDGQNWNLTSVPQPSDYQELFGIASISATDMWAVGYYAEGADELPQALHWDGSAWSLSTMPYPGPGYTELNGVSFAASNDVWAAGQREVNNVEGSIYAHWNGQGWQVVPGPNLGTGNNHLYGVAMTSPSDGWAVGYYVEGGVQKALIHRLVGATCQGPSPTPIPTGTSIGTTTATASPSPSALSTGTRTTTPVPSATANSTGTPTQATHTLTPAPPTGTPTSTPMPPTMTSPPITMTVPPRTATSIPPTSPTATPTGPTASPVLPTPTQCTISFVDVPAGSTFYTHIRCLGCLGIINGYPDGSFKPNNQVTRGQLSKVVSNSAGFSDPQPNQMFQDVPVESTYFQYIGRLASRGYMSGYPCGGTGEPCGPRNLPYFRPNSNATRGQISKIVSNAAGFSEPPSDQQYQDVLPGGTYYTYTYRLTMHFVMSGYPCGGPGLPCVPPVNLPYFLPNNNATRGQTAKIVANTFFPNCAP